MAHLSEDSPEILAARYARWDTEELVRAVDLEPGEYRPEALELIRRELDRRALTSEERTEAGVTEVKRDVRRLAGIHGRLAIFVIKLGLISLVALGAAIGVLTSPGPALVRGLSLLVGLVGLYGLVTFGLIVVRHREAPRHAKIVLGLFWLTSVGILVDSTPLHSRTLFKIASVSAAIWFWWRYLSRSPRVWLTFRPESEWYDEGPTPPPPHEPSSPAPSSPPAIGP